MTLQECLEVFRNWVIEWERHIDNIIDEREKSFARGKVALMEQDILPALRELSFNSTLEGNKRHAAICEWLNRTYTAKNSDYGNSFGDMFKELGIITAITRIGDKFNRIKTLAIKPNSERAVYDERIKDTLLDMANYCIMTVMELETQDGGKE